MEQKEKRMFIVFVAIVVCVAIIVGVSVYYGTKSSSSEDSSTGKVSALYEEMVPGGNAGEWAMLSNC